MNLELPQPALMLDHTHGHVTYAPKHPTQCRQRQHQLAGNVARSMNMNQAMYQARRARHHRAIWHNQGNGWAKHEIVHAVLANAVRVAVARRLPAHTAPPIIGVQGHQLSQLSLTTVLVAWQREHHWQEQSSELPYRQSGPRLTRSPRAKLATVTVASSTAGSGTNTASASSS